METEAWWVEWIAGAWVAGFLTTPNHSVTTFIGYFLFLLFQRQFSSFICKVVSSIKWIHLFRVPKEAFPHRKRFISISVIVVFINICTPSETLSYAWRKKPLIWIYPHSPFLIGFVLILLLDQKSQNLVDFSGVQCSKSSFAKSASSSFCFPV